MNLKFCNGILKKKEKNYIERNDENQLYFLYITDALLQDLYMLSNATRWLQLEYNSLYLAHDNI